MINQELNQGYMAPIKMNLRILTCSAIIFIFVQLVGCENARSPDEIAKARLLNAVRLLSSRDKIAAKPSKISHIKENIAAISTADVDNFVKKKIDLWINIANELESFSYSYPSNKFSKDTIFTATLLWIGISQADRQYSKKAIKVCKNALSVNYNPNLNNRTIKMLSKVPSIKYLIENELHDGNAIRSFLRGMLLTEYLKVGDVLDAEEWIETADISTEERQRLIKYINSYKLVEEKLAE